MGEIQATITPGQQTTLLPNLLSGSTIFNNSTTGSVWVSETPSATPGNGYKVGPNGSIQWQISGQAYACTDTGVTETIALTISDRIGSPVNPIDVATATAEAVNKKGIPNVLIGEMVYNGGITTGAVAYSPWVLPVDVDKYASIILAITPTAQTVMEIRWLHEASGAVVEYRSITYNPAYQQPMFIELPVKSDQLVLAFTAVNSFVQIRAYASNRAMPDAIASTTAPYVGTLNAVFTAGVTVDFPGQVYSNGKPWFCRMVVTGTNTGKLVANTLDGAGNALALTLLDTATAPAGIDGKDWTGMVLLPPGVSKLSFLPNTSGTCVAKAQLIPSY